MTETVHIAVIGGSGLYDLDALKDKAILDLDTPFGKPSAPIVVGTLAGKRVAFLPRHGEGHVYTPTTVPYQANIYALKQLGVRFIIAVSACGSLNMDYAPGHIAVPDQLFDNTRSAQRARSFFGTGFVAHVGVAYPFDPYLSDVLVESVAAAGGTVHRGGLFITIEGPRFSTRGESRVYQQWGCDIIGMTTSPEAFLAAEAEIAYACIAHITDYDVWHETEDPVTVEAVMSTAANNIKTARAAVMNAIERINPQEECPVHSALAVALTTGKAHLDPAMREKLSAIISKYDF